MLLFFTMAQIITNPEASISYTRKLYLDKIEYFLSRIEQIESQPLTPSGREEIIHCKEKILGFREELSKMPTAT